jgi:hypothetical protein
MRKTLRRHRVAVIAGGAVATALVAGVLGTTLALTARSFLVESFLKLQRITSRQ